jgi:hypothetical protein
MASRVTRFESSGFLPAGTLETLVYTAPVDNENALHHRTVDACQTIHNYPAIFEQMWRSVLRRDKMCTESHGGHFVQLL